MKCVFFIVNLFVFYGIANTQTLPWCDDFEDGDMQRWVVIDDRPYRFGPSNWEVSSGELYQTTNIYTTENELSVYKGTHIIAGNPEWTDYYFVARLSTSDDEGIGMLFRYQDEDNYYRFLTLANTNNWGLPFKRLEKQVNGRFTTLAESTNDIKIPGDFVGKIRVVGDSIYVFEDNELLFAVRDNHYKMGKIGLMCYANKGAIFDDVCLSDRDTIYEEKAYPPGSGIQTANRQISVRAMTLNIWVNGKICTPAQVAELILSLDLDFAGLQECNSTFGKQVASLTGMHMASGYDCFLYSKTPYTKINSMFVQGINAWTNIDGRTVSIYNFHIRWDEEGDRQARMMVNTFGIDPVPLQIAIGDFNDEHYSTQINIIEEHMRYCLSDLGWAPSQRVTWPAFGFYGGEGAQTIDLIFCNKKSKGRAIEGEILNTSPLLSDHKPVWATIEFPADTVEIGPQMLKAIPCFGADMIELWFDQELDSASAGNAANYHISPLDAGTSVNVSQAMLLKDPRRVRLHTSPHDFDKTYRISVSAVTDEFGVPAMAGTSAVYVVRQNLAVNFGAEDGTTGWETIGGFTAVSERENQMPYVGNYFFTGENLQDVSSGSQIIDLSAWADAIDNNIMAAEWNCYFATGYEVLGDIRASRCEPYDEGEMIVEFVDENNNVLMQATSKRWDTLFWHPYGETTDIPAGTRRAVVHLTSYRKTANGLSNDATFENVFLSIKQLTQSHGVGANILMNPSAESGDLTGWKVTGNLRARAHEDNKARPLSGYYMFSNDGVGRAEASQEFDISDYAEQIDFGELTFRWGGYMRDYRGDSRGEIKIEFSDNDDNFIGAATTGEQRIAEWWFFNTETSVPAGTRMIRYIFNLDAVADEGVYFDFLHLIPVSQTSTHVKAGNLVPNGFELMQNYPNPFNPVTIINYRLPVACKVDLTLYNLTGQKIAVLVSEWQPSGNYFYKLDGGELSSGVYFYHLTAGDFVQINKLVLLK